MINHIETVHQLRFSLKIKTSGGIPKVSPATVANQTIKYEKIAIQIILPIKVMG